MATDLGDSPLLELRLFGQARVCINGNDLTRSLPKKAVLLLAFLALRNGQPVERSHVAAMLWPDVLDTVALHNLRQLLAGLRRSLLEARDVILAPSARTLSLDLSDVRVDVSDFDVASVSDDIADLERTVSLYREALLPGCDETFAMVARDVRQQAFLTAAEKLAKKHLSAEDYSSAINVLRRILIEDPYRETACRSLMSALAASDHWPAALEFYAEFRARMRRELNTDVSAETKELFRTIKKKAIGGQQQVHKGFVPTPLTDLVGRQKAIADIQGILKMCRLVTLVGPGGVGKTRLSIAVASAISENYLEGAYFVDLSPLQDGQIIPTTIASALGVREAPGKSMFEVLTEHLATRELLLVLDNCEHLSQPVAKILKELLLAASGLTVLATSRHVLGVPGELVSSVTGLETASSRDIKDAACTDAATLFIARSRRRIDPKMERDVRAIDSICRRLDGLPLAIELAAARTQILSLQEIESRLDDRFALLSSNSQSLERHQTLRACMEWSWDMLGDGEKYLLMCLSTFRGGCSFSALQAVAEDTANVMEVLSSLVDRSLVNVSSDADVNRYTILETIREFANEKSKESGNCDRLNDLHRDFFLSFAEIGYGKIPLAEEIRWFEGCEVEHDNLRKAITWCHQKKDRYKLLFLCTCLCRFWDTHGHLNEGRDQIELALSNDGPEISDALRAKAHVHAGWIATVQQDYPAAIRHYETSIPISRALGDLDTTGAALNCLASAYSEMHEIETAEKLFLEALEIRKNFHPGGCAMILSNLADLWLSAGNYQRARSFIDQGLEILGKPSKDVAQISANVLATLSNVEYFEKEFLKARDHALASFEFLVDAHLLVEFPATLSRLAFAEAGLENWELAARILGACRAMNQSLGTASIPYVANTEADVMDQAKAAIGADRVDAAFGEGMGLEIQAVTEMVLPKEA